MRSNGEYRELTAFTDALREDEVRVEGPPDLVRQLAHNAQLGAKERERRKAKRKRQRASRKTNR